MNDAQYRAAVLALVGVENAVVVRHRRATGNANTLNDLPGTLLKAKRTRCLVRFGQTTWDFPIRDILPATEKQWQGFVV